MVSPSHAARRVISASVNGVYHNLHDRRMSPQLGRTTTGTAHGVIAKRRRSARSPSIPLSARLRNTPRWSTASPSPLPEGNPFAVPASTVSDPRQTTPFFYATPYSNVPHGDPRFPRGAVPDLDDDRGSGTDDSFDMADAGPVSEGDEDEEDDDDEVASDENRDSFMTDPSQTSGRRPVTRSQRAPAPEDEIWPGIEDEENLDPEALALDTMPSNHFGSSQQVNVYVDEDAMSDLENEDDDMSDIPILEDDTSTGPTPRHQARRGGTNDDDDAEDDDYEDENVEKSSQHSSVPSEYPSTQQAWLEQQQQQPSQRTGGNNGNGGFDVYEDKHGGR
jgi:hypothetical protein